MSRAQEIVKSLAESVMNESFIYHVLGKNSEIVHKTDNLSDAKKIANKKEIESGYIHTVHKLDKDTGKSHGIYHPNWEYVTGNRSHWDYQKND